MARTVIVTVTPPFTCGAQICCCGEAGIRVDGLRKSLPTRNFVLSDFLSTTS